MENYIQRYLNQAIWLKTQKKKKKKRKENDYVNYSILPYGY